MASLNDVLKRVQATAKGTTGDLNALATPIVKVGAVSATTFQHLQRLNGAFASIRPAMDALESKGGEVAQGFGQASLAFGSAATGLALLGGSILKTAGEFELLRGKLNAVLGDSEKAAASFDRAVAKAAQTPFDVAGVVKATISLETFGVSAEENLDRVLNLGAAFGDLDNATLAFAKAASGSLEGFESLRNTYSISTAVLKQYGGAVDEQGQVMARTTKQIAQNREALQRIIDLKFSGAVEAQSKTLVGAFSNLQDSVKNVAAGFGNTLVPAATTVAKTLSSALDVVNNLSTGMKTTLVVAGVATTGLLGMAAAATAVVAGLGLLAASVSSIVTGVEAMNLAVLAASARFPAARAAVDAFGAALVRNAAAARILATAQIPATLGTITTAFGVAGSAAIGFGNAVIVGVGTAATGLARLGTTVLAIAGPFGTVALAVGAAMAAITLGAQQSAKESEALASRLAQASKEAALADTQFRNLAGGLKTYLGVLVDYSGTAKATQANVISLADALHKLTPAQAADAFAQMGINADELNKTLADSDKGMRAMGDRLAELKDLQKLVFTNLAGAKLFNYEAATEKQRDAFAKLGGDVNTLNLLVAGTEIRFNRLSQVVQSLGLASTKFGGLSDTMKAASTEATRLDTYLKFAGRSDDVDKLKGTLGEVSTALAAASSKYEEFAGKGSSATDVLINRLKTAKDPDTIKAITDILALQQEQEKIQKTITKTTEEEAKKREDSIRDEIQAKSDLLADDRKGLQERLRLINEGLGGVRAGSDAEKALLREKAATGKKIEEDATQSLLKELKKRETTVADSIANASRNVSANATTIATATLDGVRAIEAWGVANKDALDKSPALMDAYTAALRSANQELDKARDSKAEEGFKKVNDELDKLITQADTAPSKLKAVQDAISTLQTDQKISATAATRKLYEEQITDLKGQELQLTREIEAAERALAGEVAALRQSSIENEIRLLEARKAAGEGVDGALFKKKSELRSAQLENIETERVQALKEGEDPTLVAERAELKIQALNQATTLDQYNERQKRLADAKKTADDEVGIETDKHRRIKGVQAGASNKGPTGPGATVDRQTGNYGGTSPFGSSRNSSASGPTGFGGFFDGFGEYGATAQIQRGGASPGFAGPYLDDAKFRQQMADKESLRIGGAGPSILPTPTGAPIPFGSDAERIQANIDRQAGNLAKSQADSGFGPSTNPANRPTLVGADESNQKMGQTINDMRTTTINVAGSGQVDVKGAEADRFNKWADERTRQESYYSGSGR
jgi:hypothetical protein